MNVSRTALVAKVIELAAMTLSVPASDVSAKVNIQELGFSSVSLVTFVEKVSAWLGEDVHPGVFFEHATLDAFVDYLLENKAAAVESALAGAPKAAMKEEPDVWQALEAEASAENIVAGLKNAFEDTGAQAVVLRINSPGGSPVQAGIVNDEIKRLKAKHHKKVYAVVEEVCASGAYYIAAAADEIYVDKASVVGSIGVLMDGFGFTGTMEKFGVERRLLTAGENKAMLDPFSPVNEKHVAYAKAMLDQIHHQFIAVVKEGRGKRLKETPETFSGLFWNGEEAVKLGLADSFGKIGRAHV